VLTLPPADGAEARRVNGRARVRWKSVLQRQKPKWYRASSHQSQTVAEAERGLRADAGADVGP